MADSAIHPHGKGQVFGLNDNAVAMGWRRALISLQATARQVEREAQRNQRQAERNHRRWLKEQAVAEAGRQTLEHEPLLAALTRAHVSATPTMQWKNLHEAPQPDSPSRTIERERAAQRSLQGFRPNFWDKLFGRSEQKIAALRLAVEEGRKADETDFAKTTAVYQSQLQEWQTIHAIAKRILIGDTAAFLEALKYFNEEIAEKLSITGLSFNVRSNGQIIADVGVHPIDFIPTERKTQLQTGKLSTHPYPKAEFHKIYSDYVCGTALRVAREALAIVPTPQVFVNAYTKLLDEAEGISLTKPFSPLRCRVNRSWSSIGNMSTHLKPLRASRTTLG